MPQDPTNRLTKAIEDLDRSAQRRQNLFAEVIAELNGMRKLLREISPEAFAKTAVLTLPLLICAPAFAQETCEGGYRCTPLPYGRGSEECIPSRECESGNRRDYERRPDDYGPNRERFPGYREPGEQRSSPDYGEDRE